MLSVAVVFFVLICDLTLIKVLAVQSGRHKRQSLFRTFLLPERPMPWAATGQRNVSFISWQTLGEALWLSSDFGRDSGLWDVVPAEGNTRMLVKETSYSDALFTL